MKLTNEEIFEVCEEIEIQWEYHLMTRAVFYSKFPERNNYISPGFYRIHGIEFNIQLPTIKSQTFQRASKGVGVWLNQNYAIRLFGILDSKGIIKYGEVNNIKLIKLIKLLRNNIGAHSTGRNVSRKTNLRTATKLINALFNRNLNVDQVDHYSLAVDSVLYPMKNQTKDLIRSLGKKNAA